MGIFFQKLKNLFNDKILRKRILFVFFVLLIFRFLATIPVPGVNEVALAQFLDSSQFFGLLNIFSGGGLSSLSVVMLGVGPYITASIIMQLLTIVIPKFKTLYQEEGEAGRKKFMQYSRLLTIPLAIVQGVGLTALLASNNIITFSSSFERLVSLVVILGGAVLLMWLGELISEFGIGNGVSILIFAGIVAGTPDQIKQLIATFDIANLTTYLIFIVAAIVVIAAIVLVTEAERPVAITYARTPQGGGTSSYLPLRVNQAGVMPIIFALSVLLFPQIAGNALLGASSSTLVVIGQGLVDFANNTLLYGITYFILVFAFTYFYTSITFDPKQIAENLQRSGGFVSGVRPGPATEKYIGYIVKRITLFGGLFLGVVAVLPIVMQAITGFSALTIGGTALLIVVSVILDILKRVDAQLSMREY